MNTVINPITGNRHNIHSKIGRALLKSYLLSYKFGGMDLPLPSALPPVPPSESQSTEDGQDLTEYMYDCERTKEELDYLERYVNYIHLIMDNLTEKNAILHQRVYGIPIMGADEYWSDDESSEELDDE